MWQVLMLIGLQQVPKNYNTSVLILGLIYQNSKKNYEIIIP